MQDIASRADIELLVNRFYEKVLTDELIGHFFAEVIPIDFKTHMPIMYSFWETR